MEPGVGAAASEMSLSSVVTSPLLKSLLGDRFPKIDPLLEFFENAFDQKRAEREGSIIPNDVSPG